MAKSLLDALQVEATVTENNMPTNTSSLSSSVDFFATIGSARGWTKYQIVSYFSKALADEPLVAMKIMFWARDCRGGAGERDVFRKMLSHLATYNEGREYLTKNAHLVSEYGRWDDLFCLIGTYPQVTEYVLNLIKEGLNNKNGLLAKWLPRKGPIANTVRRHLDLTPKEYRQLIVGLSKTVETQMCAKKWDEIKYEHVPSCAMNKYRKAFKRNDETRFAQFITDVNSGKTDIKAGVLFPYQLYDAYVLRNEDPDAIEAQWNALPNYMTDNPYNILPICDVSGSMMGGMGSVTPMSVSVSLGIYISERNIGKFKDAFITFSDHPKLQYLKGSFTQRCKQLSRAEWAMSTNIEAVYNLILTQAIKHKVHQSEMPNMLLIMSDMQFNQGVRLPDASHNTMIRKMYENAGYEMPNIIFWNINARVDKIPVTINDKGMAIVSGCSPAILKAILSGVALDPVSIMMAAINADRYSAITV